MSGAAGALRDLARRQAGTTPAVAAAGVWKGPASEAFAADSAGSRAGLERAAASLDQAAAALAELAARLEHAQATWDRAQRLAAVVGVELNPAGGPPAPIPGRHPGSGSGSAPGSVAGTSPRAGWSSGSHVASPVTAVDPAASLVAGQAFRIAEAAEEEAAAARRVAAARLDQAAAAIGPAGGGPGPTGRPGHGAGSAHGERHPGPVERVVNRALEVGAEVATGTHHLVSAAEARLAAAGRLAAVADNPAVRAAAGKVAETAGRPMLDGRIVAALPLAAPVLDFTAAVRDGEPLPRALAGALGSADLGGRRGEAAATSGAGLIVCPTLTAVGGVLGAQAGRAAFLHVYDELTESPDPDPAPEETVMPGPGPGPEPRPGG